MFCFLVVFIQEENLECKELLEMDIELREKTKKDNRDIEKDTFSSSFDSSRLK
jgi:hypothetical protein